MGIFGGSLLKSKDKAPLSATPKNTLAALVVKPPAKKQQKKKQSMPKLPLKTDEQHLSDYAEFMIEAWEDSDGELVEADFDDIDLGDDDLGMADETVENTRGTVLKYDLRGKASHNVIRVGGGDIGSVPGEFEPEGTPEQIKQWLAEIEINGKILFDAENPDLFDAEDSDEGNEEDDEEDESPAPVITLDPEGVQDQFARLRVQDYGIDAGCWASDESFLAERSPSPSQPETLGFGELANGDPDLLAPLPDEVFKVLDDEPSDAGGDKVDETALEYACPRRPPRQLIPMSKGMNLLLDGSGGAEKHRDSAPIEEIAKDDWEAVPLTPVPSVEKSVRINAAPDVEGSVQVDAEPDSEQSVSLTPVLGVEFLPGIEHLTNLTVRPMWISFDGDYQDESVCLLHQNAYSEDVPRSQGSNDCETEIEEDADFIAYAPVQPVRIFDSDTSQQVGYSALDQLLWTYDELEDDEEDSSDSYLFTFFDDSVDSYNGSEVGDQEKDLYQLSPVTYFDVNKQQDIGYAALNQLLEDPFTDFSGIHRMDDIVELEDSHLVEEAGHEAGIWSSSCFEGPISFSGKQYSLKALSTRRSSFLDDEFDTIGLDSRPSRGDLKSSVKQCSGQRAKFPLQSLPIY